MKRNQIIKEIEKERNRQDTIHPFWIPNEELSILIEEVGEVAKAQNENDTENLKEELIQVASVCVRWLEEMEE